jgi:hypothetical protein
MNLHKIINVACNPFRCVKQGDGGSDLHVENIYFQVDGVDCFSVISTQKRDRNK